MSNDCLKKNCYDDVVARNANRRIPVSHQSPQGFLTRVPHDGKQTGSPLDQWDMVLMQWYCRLSTGLPLSSQLCRLWSQKEDLQGAWNRDRRAVWDQRGLSHCWHDSLVTVRHEACLRWGHNNQSHWGHQCSETTLTGESPFHISPPMGFEPGSLMAGSKRVVHWTSEKSCECSEIAGSTMLSIHRFKRKNLPMITQSIEVYITIWKMVLVLNSFLINWRA